MGVRCPVHDMPDCSPLLNGCSLMTARYACDGCMRIVTARDIAVWADFEHVLCRECDRQERERA